MIGLRALLLVALLPVLLPEAAHADPGVGAVGLSSDGRHWTGALTSGLFDSSVRWVPGDVRTARLYVRNQGETAGDLTVDILRTRRDALLDTGWLTISARAGSGAWSEVAQGGRQRLLESRDLPTGHVVPVDVRVRLDRLAPNGTQVLATDLDLRVTLSDSAASGAGGEAGPTGLLPDTGAPIPPWLPPLALLALAGGLLLVLRHRRTDPTDPERA